MIIVRLFLHGRDTRTTARSLVGTDGLYKAIITMLIESSALYAVSSLLVIGTFASRSWAADLFLPVLAEAQVRSFSQLQSPDQLLNAMTDWTGHRSTSHH